MSRTTNSGDQWFCHNAFSICRTGELTVTHSSQHPRRVLAITWCTWQVAFLLCYVADGVIGCHDAVRSVVWWLFGVPSNLYSVWNILIPRVICIMVFSSPCALLALLVYARQAQFSMQTLAIAIAAFGGLLGLIVWQGAAPTAFQPTGAIFLIALLFANVPLWACLVNGPCNAP